MSSDIQSYPFVINETPYCVWDEDIHQLNRRFIESIEPEYFDYLVQTHNVIRDETHTQHASIALRMAYGHAVETLLALICAAVQAPECVFGWMTKYKNNELDDLCAAITNGDHFRTRLELSERSWIGIAAVVWQGADEVIARTQSELYGTFWSMLAHEHLSDESRGEYNSLKHGMRAKATGMTISIGESGSGTQMVKLGNEFGTSYIMDERVVTHDRVNLRFSQHARGWHPERFAKSLPGITASINNVKAFLQRWNKYQSATTVLQLPDDYIDVLLASKRELVRSFKMGRPLDIPSASLVTKDAVLASYRNEPTEPR